MQKTMKKSSSNSASIYVKHSFVNGVEALPPSSFGERVDSLVIETHPAVVDPTACRLRRGQVSCYQTSLARNPAVRSGTYDTFVAAAAVVSSSIGAASVLSSPSPCGRAPRSVNFPLISILPYTMHEVCPSSCQSKFQR